MKFTKCKDYLTVEAKLNFGYDNYLFCGIPWVHLLAAKDKSLFYKANTICIAVHDYDDYDVGLVYKVNDENFFDVLHELINWMHDHEQGINDHDKLMNPFTFFPYLGCERGWW